MALQVIQVVYESHKKLATTFALFSYLNQTAHFAIIKPLQSLLRIPIVYSSLFFCCRISQFEFEISKHQIYYTYTLCITAHIHLINVVFWLSHTLLCRFQFSFTERLFALVSFAIFTPSFSI